MKNKTAIIYYIIIIPILLCWLYEHMFGDFAGSCSYNIDKFANKLGVVEASSSSTRLANQFIRAAQEKEYAFMTLMVDKNAIDAQLIHQLADEFPQTIGEQKLILSENELIGFHRCSAKKQIAVTFMHKLTQGKNLFIDLVYKELDDLAPTIAGFHFNTASSAALDPVHQISFANLSEKQIIVCITWLLIPLLILISLVMCIKKDYVKHKFLWMLFILFGIGSIDFDWTSQIFFTKLFSTSFLGVGWFKTSCHVPLILKLSLPIGAILFLFKVFLVRVYFPNCKNPTINKLLLRYAQYREKKRIIAEEEWKKLCLDTYGVYHNAHELSREEMLEIFWKILKGNYYDVSSFNINTSFREAAAQNADWDDLGAEEFLYEAERIFGILDKEISDEEYENLKTFGECAELIIKKAKINKIFTVYSVDEIEIIIQKLRDVGLSQMETIKILMSKFNMKLADANECVPYSIAWKDCLESTIKLNKAFWEAVAIGDDATIRCSCPCCRNLTLSKMPGTDEICQVCGWEDDDVQFNNPDYNGGVNGISLNQAKENYKEFGAISKEVLKNVREPLPDEIPSEPGRCTISATIDLTKKGKNEK